MTTISRFATIIAFMSLFTACGLQEGEDTGNPPDVIVDGGDTGDTGDATDVDLPAPFRSPEACILDFSTRYVSDATCGEVRGNLPGMSWTEGVYVEDTDGDGYLGMSYEVPPGTYEISYLGYQNCAERTPHEAWAQYGHPEDLMGMSAEALSYIQCNWYDASTGEYINDLPDPHCNIRITVDDQCNITGAGNMGDFNAE